jgi:hypothetical protein
MIAKEKSTSWKVPAVLIFVTVWALWIAWWRIVPILGRVVDIRWIAGDMFAPLNTLFAGLAFAGFTIAIFLQRDELALQRQELEQTREVMKHQGAQLQEQAAVMHQQAFETRYFNLLGLIREIVAAMPEGQEYFNKVCQKITGAPVLPQPDGTLLRFDEIWKGIGARLAPYLKTLDTVAHVALTGGKDPSFFMALLVCQMTAHERVVLAFCVRAERA